MIMRPEAQVGCDDLLNSARNILLNRLFLGDYIERRYVEQLEEYRDVITVSPAETELMVDLDKVRRKLVQDHSTKWVGITVPNSKGDPMGYCIWVKLTNVPFGRFWFQIKQIKSENDEIVLKLKCVRQAHVQDNEAPDINKNSAKEKDKSHEESSEYSFEFNLPEKIEIVYNCFSNAISQVGPHVTWENTLLVSKFVVAIMIVLVNGLILAVKYFLEYFLRLTHELGYLVQSATPVIMHVIDSLTKLLGGIFCLIAVMFRGAWSDNSKPSGQSKYNELIEQRPFQLPQRGASSQDRYHPPLQNEVMNSLSWRERNRHLKMQLHS